MKKLSIKIFVLAIVASLTSCIDYDDVTRAVSVDVQLVMPEEFTGTDYEGHTVTLTQKGKESVFSAVTDANGIAKFKDLIPDVYTINTSWDLTSAQYNLLTGDNQVNDGVVVSGTISNQLIAENQSENPLKLPTQLSINRSLVIGKVYYAGTKNNSNKNYTADQYIEIYNQSDDSINIGGLCIGLVESDSKGWTAEYLSAMHPDSTALKQIFRIPDLETEKWIKPGSTIVIANSAIDHTTVSSGSPNLLNADFDVLDTRTKNAYINNPDVPDMETLYTFSKSTNFMNLLNGGPCGVVIFRAEPKDVESWPVTYAYGKTSGSEYKLIPNKVIIDAVEILKYNKEGTVNIDTKRLVNGLDAGYTFIPATTGYTGDVVYRKTSTRKGKNGHKILVDTNNSTTDFKVSKTIQPREYEE